jgi:hypothetical protein
MANPMTKVSEHEATKRFASLVAIKEVLFQPPFQGIKLILGVFL